MVRYAQPENGAIAEQVINEVAAERGEDPLDLPPLYEAIDPDALENLFRNVHGGSGARGRVVFTLAECGVAVHSTGEVVVTALDGNRPGSTAFGNVDDRDGAASLE